MLKSICFIALSIVGMVWHPLHPIHVAVSDMVYNPKSKSLEITHKIFMDDIEQHIESIYKSRGVEVALHLNTPKQNPKADEYLKEYLETHFKIKINGKLVAAQYIGKEYETDAVWLYAEIPKLKSLKSVEITDEILTDLHDDQDNLVHLKYEALKKSLRLNNGNQTGLIEVD